MSNDSSAAESRLADNLEATRATLVARSLEYMAQDEFWQRRYAARAQRFANEDGAFHVRYLVDALRAGSPTVMAEYGKWLRDLLVPRGMCTLHLVEHFEHLWLAMEPEAGNAPALRYVRAGIDALAYPKESPARAVQQAAAAVEEQVPSLTPLSGTSRNSAWQTRYLCHYVADAIARADEALLSTHVNWARSLYASDHGSTEPFDEWVGAVSAALGGVTVPAAAYLAIRETGK